MEESLASPAPGGASFPLASPAPGWRGTPSTLNPNWGALPGGGLPPSLAGFGRGSMQGWGFNPDPDLEASSATPSLLLGARGGVPGAAGAAALGAATPAAGTAGMTPGPGGPSPYPRLDPADAVNALLRSPNPGGVLEDLLQATSMRRGGAVPARGASPLLPGSGLASDAPGAGFYAALPELGSPRLAAAPAHSGSAERLGAGCKVAAPAVSAQLVVESEETAGHSMALAGQPTSPAKQWEGADGSPADTAAHTSTAKGSGSQPEPRVRGSPQALPLLLPADKAVEGSGQDPSPGMDPAGSPLAAWAEAWAAGAAGAQGLGSGMEAGEGQGPDPAGFQSLRGSLESSRSLSPRLMLRFEAALAEVSAAPSPAGDPPAGSVLGGGGGLGDLAAAQAEAAPRSPAEDPTGLWAGANLGSAALVDLPRAQAMPWQGEAGSVGDLELQAMQGGDSLSGGQAEALGSGPGSHAPQLRRSLEAALAEAGRDSGPNPVAQPDPAAGSPADSERSGAGPALLSPPSPPPRRPGSVGDALDAERYSPAGEGPLIGAGAGRASNADATPGIAMAGGRAVGGGVPNLGLAFGSPGSGSPVAAPLSPATVQRHMRTYNSVALADAEDEVLDPEDEGLDPGSPGGAGGGYPRSDLGQGWRDALFAEDGGSAGKGPGSV